MYTLNNLVGNSSSESNLKTLSEILKNQDVKKRINEADQNGDLALIMACKNGNEKAVAILLENGANPNMPPTRNGETAYEALGASEKGERIKQMLDGALCVSKEEVSQKTKFKAR